MTPPLVSVIIPTYNRRNFLLNAIRSVQSQSFQNFEIIIVDDGSQDETEEMVITKKLEDARIRYIKHSANRGAQAARNSGIQAAQGSYIAFLDSDNEWLPAKLEQQIEVITYPGHEVGVVYCGFTRVSETGGVIANVYPRHRGHIYQIALTEWIADTSTLIIRRDELEKAGPLSEQIRANQEWDLCIRLAQYCAFDFISECLVLYHLHSLPTISKDLLRDAYGYLDVITAHSNEVVEECGRGALSKHYFIVGQRLMKVGRLDLARQNLWQSLQLVPFSPIVLLYLGVTFLGIKGYRFLKTIKHCCQAV